MIIVKKCFKSIRMGNTYIKPVEILEQIIENNNLNCNAQEILKQNPHFLAQFTNITSKTRRQRLLHQKTGLHAPVKTSYGNVESYYHGDFKVSFEICPYNTGRILCVNIVDAIKPACLDCFLCI